MDQLKVGVIGCGYWGPNLVRNFSTIQESCVAAVCDLDAGRLDTISRRYPIGKLTTNADDIFGDPAIVAVAIATPISTHADLAMRAIRAGKHVLLEKPMAHSLPECRALIAAARERGLVLMVDHTFLYTGAVMKMKQLVDAGELGDIFYFDSVRANLGLFQHDYNVIWDLAPHDLSIMVHLLNQRPVQVSATGASPVALGKSRLESVAYITVRFDSGVIGHIHVNWLAPVKVRQTLIGGARKMIVYDDMEPDLKVKVYDSGVDIVEPEQREKIYNTLVQYRTGDMFAPKLDKMEALRRECLHFIQCITEGKTPITSGDAGLEVVRLLLAANDSLHNHGRPVDLERH